MSTAYMTSVVFFFYFKMLVWILYSTCLKINSKKKRFFLNLFLLTGLFLGLLSFYNIVVMNFFYFFLNWLVFIFHCNCFVMLVQLIIFWFWPTEKVFSPVASSSFLTTFSLSFCLLLASFALLILSLYGDLSAFLL